MALIHTQTSETAEGEVRKIYDQILEVVPFVPKPVQLFSASPELMTGYWRMMQRVIAHPRVSRPTMALLRLGVAMESDFPYCIEFNSASLKMLLELSDEELAEVRKDPSKAKLPEPELTLALFVIRAVREPESVTAADIQQLRDLGWDDEAIFVATFQGAFMLAVGALFTIFKMHED